MGCVPHIPNPDDEKSGKKYTKFLIVLEILYAILTAWGFARVAEYFDFSNIYNWAGLLIATFVLIRFFFAPSHNVGGLIRNVKMNAAKARAVIFFDIPILIAHSFIYYRICYNITEKQYDFFYFNLALLLFLNSVWLVSIRFRMKRDGVKSPPKFCLWINNNLIFSILLFTSCILYKYFNVIGPSVFFWLGFALALSNCVIDLVSCALDYFEDV
jgi:hypothetical protein